MTSILTNLKKRFPLIFTSKLFYSSVNKQGRLSWWHNSLRTQRLEFKPRPGQIGMFRCSELTGPGLMEYLNMWLSNNSCNPVLGSKYMIKTCTFYLERHARTLGPTVPALLLLAVCQKRHARSLVGRRDFIDQP